MTPQPLHDAALLLHCAPSDVTRILEEQIAKLEKREHEIAKLRAPGGGVTITYYTGPNCSKGEK